MTLINKAKSIAHELGINYSTVKNVLNEGCLTCYEEEYCKDKHGSIAEAITNLCNELNIIVEVTIEEPKTQPFEIIDDNGIEESKSEYSEDLVAASSRLEKDKDINLLTMYCQSGKTGKCIDLIDNINIDSYLTKQKVIHVVVTANNLLLTTQTHRRAQHHITKDVKIKINATRIASNSKSSSGFKNYNTTKSIFVNGNKVIKKTCKQAISDGDINVITVCNNLKRWDDIDKIVDDLSNTNYKIVIFIDEADTCLSKIDFINKFHLNKNVIKIVLITATPYDANIRMKRIKWIGEHFNTEGRLNLVSLDEKHGDNYHSLTSSNIEYFEPEDISDGDYIEYTLRYTQENPPQTECIDILPAGPYRETHEQMVDNILPYYDYAIIINGENKEIRESEDLGGKIISLKKNPSINYLNDEISEWLGKWIQEHGKHKKIFITGWFCIGRGLTYSSDKYKTYINKIIMNHDKGLADLIQMLSRTSGYTNAEPTVITTKRIWNVAKINHDLMDELTGCAVNGKLNITSNKIKEMFDRISNKYIHKRRKHYKIFPNLEAVINDPKFTPTGRTESNQDRCYMAPKTLLNNGRVDWTLKDVKTEAVMSDNPTLNYTLERWWGTGDNQRFIPLNDGTWIKYWYESIEN
tara:strand:+ start:71 stop:1981 length:1911 start_codon:yes stop_codon:yes gene_type:complete